MPYPKISIVTASYNQGQFLERTILSVLDQQYPNLEYIIIDGGSTDNSVEIIRKYEDRLTFWVSESDKGQYDAINKGFSHSSGEILAFINADDLYLPWSLHTVASMFEQHAQVEWITSLSPFQTNSDGVISSFGKINPISRRAFIEGYYVPTTAEALGVVVQEGTFWRRSLWEKAGSAINLQRGLAGDFDLWCRFIRFAEPYNTGYPLGVMTRHKDQRSNLIQQYVSECRESLKELQHDLPGAAGTRPWRHRVVKLFRINHYFWSVGRKLLNFRAFVIEPTSATDVYTTSWKIKTIDVYMKNS